ncbi:hypothetical protein [Ramlibacter sp.]|uniref:hypothetical protein n=1 Tax=Ramlibacter sp. TaxID=1917967 RepID=UPI002FC5CE5B
MCYLVREQTAGAAEPSPTPAGQAPHPRARWIGAVTAALVGGFAIAALDAPTPQAPTVQVREAAAAVPVAARSSVIPPAPLDRTALPVDDGVPSATDMAKARAGDCQHGL